MTVSRATRRSVLLLGLLLGGWLPLAGQEGDRSLFWRELAVEARLDADGRLHVRERQAMVFDGAWNGGERRFDVRLGQRLVVHGLTRIDAATGERTPLREGDLESVDRYARDGSSLRWRSRLPSDPPFRNREIVYEIDYTLGPVVVPGGGRGYSLRHDFAFADRVGVIERVRVVLELDRWWMTPAGQTIEGTAEMLPPGSGFTLEVPLWYAADGAPAAVAAGAPRYVRGAVAGAALFVPLLVFLGLRRRDRELDRDAPLTPPERIDEAWLRSHLFAYPPEVIGASWDASVGGPEVAALLARLVGEGKLTSRVEGGGSKAVLHLRRVAPLSSFEPHERALLEALFFDGADETDTASVRKHYKQKGFAPASLIEAELKTRLEALPGGGRVARRWVPAAAAMVAGAVLAMGGAVRDGGTPIGIVGLIAAAVAAAISLGSAAVLAMRVTYRRGPRTGVLLPIAIAAGLLTLLAAGLFEGRGGMPFYRPGTPLLVGLAMLLVAIGSLAIAIARPVQTAERLAFRRRLVSARRFFQAELARPEPRLQDSWFPYLLAFGLGPQVDRWFREFAGAGGDVAMVPLALASAGGTGRGSSSGSGWTGGGPQFGGGGGFGGGGVSGSWSVAAAGMASGVAAPSSSGGGGSSSSGGGGGGGW
jgi:uncharacterized membrane protein YgcG